MNQQVLGRHYTIGSLTIDWNTEQFLAVCPLFTTLSMLPGCCHAFGSSTAMVDPFILSEGDSPYNHFLLTFLRLATLTGARLTPVRLATTRPIFSSVLVDALCAQRAEDISILIGSNFVGYYQHSILCEFNALQFLQLSSPVTALLVMQDSCCCLCF